MLSIIQHAVINATPTAIDSLKQSVDLMQAKIDSLQKVVTKTEIGSGFFSEVISSNLITYTTIIGLAALISWGVIGRMLFYHKKTVGAAADKAVKDHAEKYNESLEEIKTKLLRTIYDVSRSMYFISLTHATRPISLYWAMITLYACTKNPKFKAGTLDMWINIAYEHACSLNNRDEFTTKNLKKYLLIFDILEAMPILNSQENIQRLKNEVLSVVYSKPPVTPNYEEIFPDEGS